VTARVADDARLPGPIIGGAVDVTVNPEIRLPPINEIAEVARVAPAQIHVRVRQRERMRRMVGGHDPSRRAARGLVVGRAASFVARPLAGSFLKVMDWVAEKLRATPAEESA